jgi:hypothetical protein
MKTAFLIYKPVLDYEESEHSYCVCSTRETAQEMIDHTLALFEKMRDELDEFDTSIDLDDEEYDKNWKAQREKEDEFLKIIENDPIASMFSFSEYKYNGKDCLEITEIPYYI